MKSMRIDLIMWLARILGVPIDVNQAFFAKGIKANKS